MFEDIILIVVVCEGMFLIMTNINEVTIMFFFCSLYAKKCLTYRLYLSTWKSVFHEAIKLIFEKLEILGEKMEVNGRY